MGDPLRLYSYFCDAGLRGSVEHHWFHAHPVVLPKLARQKLELPLPRGPTKHLMRLLGFVVPRPVG